MKILARAKSRLTSDGPASQQLALAFFLDTLSAVQACRAVGDVVVVTSDPVIARSALERDCTVISDAGHSGINAAARWAAKRWMEMTGGPARPTAVIMSDLPCLRADDLTHVLTLAAAHQTAFLADADGTGTTMWLSLSGTEVDPHFGDGSREAHVRSAAADLVELHPDRAPALIGARRDVDTGDALAAARLLGVGQHTSLLLEQGVAPASVPDEIVVTVFGSDGITVTVVDESGVRREAPWELAGDAGLLHARPGQRLVALLLPSGGIGALRLP